MVTCICARSEIKLICSHTDTLENLPIAILKIRRDGVVEFANNKAAMLLAVDNAQGTALARLVDGPGRQIADWLRDAFEGRGLNQSQTMHIKASNGDRYVQITLSQSGSGLIAVLTDATELKMLESQMVQSQKMQAIGQLAGGVAHDFNNLLTAIGGSCDLLTHRFDKQDEIVSDLKDIRKNVDRAANLVCQLLAYSRKQPLNTTHFGIQDLITDCTTLLSGLIGPNSVLQIDVDPDLPKIRSDKMQLERVLMNLVMNAHQAMGQSGTIKLRACQIEIGNGVRKENVNIPAGEYILMDVQDHGIGIAPEIRQKIFEPFFTTKKPGQGTGLGLSMVYGIVKQSGGFVFAESRPGLGTTISVYLPVDAGAYSLDEGQVAPLQTKNVAAASGSVLLVEDEDAVRSLSARALRLRGYSVFEADCAEQALGMLSDSTLDVDVFLTDVIMPGLDGPDWVRMALVDRPDTKVIFVSGYSDDAFTSGDSPVPNSTFLAKPYSLAQLAAVVHDQLV